MSGSIVVLMYMDFFNIPQTVPKVTLPAPDTGQLIEDNAARIERELQVLDRSDT